MEETKNCLCFDSSVQFEELRFYKQKAAEMFNFVFSQVHIVEGTTHKPHYTVSGKKISSKKSYFAKKIKKWI